MTNSIWVGLLKDLCSLVIRILDDKVLPAHTKYQERNDYSHAASFQIYCIRLVSVRLYVILHLKCVMLVSVRSSLL